MNQVWQCKHWMLVILQEIVHSERTKQLNGVLQFSHDGPVFFSWLLLLTIWIAGFTNIPMWKYWTKHIKSSKTDELLTFSQNEIKKNHLLTLLICHSYTTPYKKLLSIIYSPNFSLASRKPPGSCSRRTADPSVEWSRSGSWLLPFRPFSHRLPSRWWNLSSLYRTKTTKTTQESQLLR